MTSPQGRNVVTRKEKLRRANSLAQGHSSGEGGAGQDSIPRLPASRACHPGNLGRGWMTPGPQDPHCHQGCFPAASPVHHPVHPCPQVLGGLCSFHSGPSFCTLPPKATPPPCTPSVSEDAALHVWGPGSHQAPPAPNPQTLVYLGSWQELCRSAGFCSEKKLLPGTVAGLVKNSLGDRHSMGFPRTEKSSSFRDPRYGPQSQLWDVPGPGPLGASVAGL